MPGRILAIDYGERRLGIALSDPLRIIASPHCTLDTQEVPDPLSAIELLVRENDVERIVIGIPLHLDGRLSEKALKVRAFAGQLQSRLPEIPVEESDERYSSVEAHRILKSRKKRGPRPSKEAVDRLAAAVILQEWLDANPGSPL